MLSRVFIVLFILFDAVIVVWFLVHGHTVAVLQPKGLIADQERNLIFLAVSLMLAGVIPVFILALFVGRKYRAGNTKAAYHPDWDHHTGLQIFFWVFLTAIMSALCVVVWIGAHKLDPHVAIEPTKKPFVVQVFALRWKWLFVYPQQGIASVNYLEFPEKTPVEFEITSYDSPMTSFWIPQLGGQVYAMSGMATQTHLMADGIGEYRGQSSEINGEGFSDMVFTAQSVPNSDFNAWVDTVKQSPNVLTYEAFQKLAKPQVDTSTTFYSSTPEKLFITIVMHYMAPTGGVAHMEAGKTEGRGGM